MNTEIPKCLCGCNTFGLAEFSRRVVIRGIFSVKSDKPEMKRRIMLARQCGFLTHEQGDAWVRLYGLREA